MKLSAMNNFNKLATNETPLTKQKELLGLDYLNDELSDDDYDGDVGLVTKGDSLINQFYNGNWSASVQEMKDHFIWWNELLDYMQDHEIWSDFIKENDHFDHAFWGELGHTLGRKS